MTSVPVLVGEFLVAAVGTPLGVVVGQRGTRWLLHLDEPKPPASPSLLYQHDLDDGFHMGPGDPASQSTPISVRDHTPATIPRLVKQTKRYRCCCCGGRIKRTGVSPSWKNPLYNLSGHYDVCLSCADTQLNVDEREDWSIWMAYDIVRG